MNTQVTEARKRRVGLFADKRTSMARSVKTAKRLGKEYKVLFLPPVRHGDALEGILNAEYSAGYELDDIQYRSDATCIILKLRDQ